MRQGSCNQTPCGGSGRRWGGGGRGVGGVAVPPPPPARNLWRGTVTERGGAGAGGREGPWATPSHRGPTTWTNSNDPEAPPGWDKRPPLAGTPVPPLRPRQSVRGNPASPSRTLLVQDFVHAVRHTHDGFLHTAHAHRPKGTHTHTHTHTHQWQRATLVHSDGGMRGGRGPMRGEESANNRYTVQDTGAPPRTVSRSSSSAFIPRISAAFSFGFKMRST
jgi:hypothetical protein